MPDPAPVASNTPRVPITDPEQLESQQISDEDFARIPEEQRRQMALAALRAGKFKSIRGAAKWYRVAHNTLGRRLQGGLSRTEAHIHQRHLSQAQEDILAEWIKRLGKRGVPLSLSTIGSFAEKIHGAPLGKTWSTRFKARRPDLKVKWTSSLEECRARALNRPAVHKYFALLEEVISEYDIKPKNIYNMDEKGIQLGIGDRIRALVDRDQKVVHKTESGNRDLVTIIECIAADGTALHPSVVFQGLRRDLRWGENNPCDASISISAKGWTDQELGALWLEKDFAPASAKRLDDPSDYRLLILDGHNSHCTYSFVDFAQKHRIVVICLPSHTTHGLQPCDVGVFSPLSSSWKAQVSKQHTNGVVIDKYNLLANYAEARSVAFKEQTIIAAFRKCGICPLNEKAIPEHLFEPAQNYTTQAAMPLPPRLPSLLVPAASNDVSTTSTSSRVTRSQIVPALSTSSATLTSSSSTRTSTRSASASTANPLRSSASTSSSSRAAATSAVIPAPRSSRSTSTNSSSTSATATHSTTSTTEPRPSTPTQPARTAADTRQARDAVKAAYEIAMPSPVRKTASRTALAAENEQLRGLLKVAGVELDKNYAQMILMELENGRLRTQLFAKKNKRKRKYTTAEARLMTSTEMQQALLEELQKKLATQLHSEMKKKLFPAIRKAIASAEKAGKAAAKKREQQARAAARAAAKAAKVRARVGGRRRVARGRRASQGADRDDEEWSPGSVVERGRGRGARRGGRARGVGARGVGRGRGGARRGGVDKNVPDTDASAESDPDGTQSEQDEGTEPSGSVRVRGKGRSRVRTANEGEQSTAETDNSNGEDRGADEPTDEEDDAEEPDYVADFGPLALPPGDETDDEDEDSEEEETEIESINGHRWEARRNLQFQVVWKDGDVTWEPLSNVNDCAALEDYLTHHDIDDPLRLSRRKYRIDETLKGNSE